VKSVFPNVLKSLTINIGHLKTKVFFVSAISKYSETFSLVLCQPSLLVSNHNQFCKRIHYFSSKYPERGKVFKALIYESWRIIYYVSFMIPAFKLDYQVLYIKIAIPFLCWMLYKTITKLFNIITIFTCMHYIEIRVFLTSVLRY